MTAVISDTTRRIFADQFLTSYSFLPQDIVELLEKFSETATDWQTLAEYIQDLDSRVNELEGQLELAREKNNQLDILLGGVAGMDDEGNE